MMSLLLSDSGGDVMPHKKVIRYASTRGGSYTYPLRKRMVFYPREISLKVARPSEGVLSWRLDDWGWLAGDVGLRLLVVAPRVRILHLLALALGLAKKNKVMSEISCTHWISISFRWKYSHPHWNTQDFLWSIANCWRFDWASIADRYLQIGSFDFNSSHWGYNFEKPSNLS